MYGQKSEGEDFLLTNNVVKFKRKGKLNVNGSFDKLRTSIG
jgi:hypothetical protein